VLAVVGATATGKSTLGIELATRLGGEVVNADSMQLYRGMDIGTAKLAVEEQRGIRHHLLDVWEIQQTASVADYQSRARAAIADITARGRLPILVGGSGLYVTAALDDVDFPGTDEELRRTLESELATVGPHPLHRRLAAVDAAAALSIHPSNGRRIVRALEVNALTGEPFRTTFTSTSAYDDVVVIGLRRPRELLAGRIERRVDRMFRGGLVDEVRRLDQDFGLRHGMTARRALGYAQVLDLLDGRLPDEAAAAAATVAATRRFARRQDSWFARDRRIHWLEGDSDDLVDRAVSVGVAPRPPGRDRGR
jgi:tRNA dimethylallyltransferase